MKNKPIKNKFFTEHDDGSITFNGNLIVSDTPRTDAILQVAGMLKTITVDQIKELERENIALKKYKEMLEIERCECLRTMSLALNNNAGKRENLRLLRILSRIRSVVDHSPDMSQATRLEWVGEYLDDALGKEAQP